MKILLSPQKNIILFSFKTQMKWCTILQKRGIYYLSTQLFCKSLIIKFAAIIVQMFSFEFSEARGAFNAGCSSFG